MTLQGETVPPKQRVFFYSADEWEEFILEWAIGLKGTDTAEIYVQVKRLGGPGDGGIDVAAFKTDQQLEGRWDCFQCKHYAEELTFKDVAPEMLKVFYHVEAGDYALPDRYLFLAPQGCATSLNRLLSTPAQLQEKFLKNLKNGTPLVKNLSPHMIEALHTRAAGVDFSIFKAVQLHEVLEVHRRTQYHAARFGAQLPSRSAPLEPPEVIAEGETQYVLELRRAYAEKDPDTTHKATELSKHPSYGGHFKRQRVSFYKAESLRMDARDAVPDGTFEVLQGDVYDGVIDIVESNYSTGLDRLTAALAQATSLSLGLHPLVSITRPDDLKGICHQLANDSRLSWTKDEE